MTIDEKRIPVIFKALCDENRVKIMQYLMSGEKCACKILEDMNIAQSTLSHHMRILTESGLVSARKDGKWMHYSISPDGIDIALECLACFKNVKCDNSSGCCNE